MRVLVASDQIGALGSAAAGEVLARAWTGAQLQVLPVGEAGSGFLTALADRLGVATSTRAGAGPVETHVGEPGDAVRGVGVEVVAPDGALYEASSRPLGDALAPLLTGPTPERIYVDLAGSTVHDAGAGLLAALGASADVSLEEGARGLVGLGRLDLTAVRSRLGSTRLVGVVPSDQLAQPLCGLRGITSLVGRTAGAASEEMLAVDAALEQLARLAGPELVGAPGAGACGGLGLAVLALGGSLTSGPAVALAEADLRQLDLVLTGCSVFDFARRGGGVVAAAAAAAAEALCPCVVVAGEVVIGSREMRTMGVEAAYAVRESSLDRPSGGDVTAEELAALARRVARSWRW
ncbi:MAG: putative glycerate kinase [Friedmanniella sp.]|nr:putative glycerate kinase [Friedmanniella sp.]